MRRAFGVLFLAISAALLSGTLLIEFIGSNHYPVIFNTFIWVACFGIIFAVIFTRFRSSMLFVRKRMKQSVKWPMTAKVQVFKNLKPDMNIKIKEDSDSFTTYELNKINFTTVRSGLISCSPKHK